MSQNLKRKLLPLFIIIAAIVIMFILLNSKAPPEQKQPEVRELLVEVVEVKALQKKLTVRTQGTVTPKIKSSLTSEVTGRITWISDVFVNGGYFNKGDVLVKVDTFDYETALKSAKASLARANATLAEEKARAKVAEAEWQAFKKGKAPDLYIRAPQLAREQANVNAAQAELDKAQRNLDRTQIKASFNGIIKAKRADLGQFINKGAIVAEVFGTDVAEIRLPVSDNDMAFLSFQSAYDIQTLKPPVLLQTLANNQSLNWQAHIVRSEGIVDEMNRMVFLVAELNDPYGIQNKQAALEFGRFVYADIIGETNKELVIVKRDLLLDESNILVAKDNKLVVQPITVDKLDKQYAYVSQGLVAGDKVISTKIKNPLTGSQIKIVGEFSSNSEQGNIMPGAQQ